MLASDDEKAGGGEKRRLDMKKKKKTDSGAHVSNKHTHTHTHTQRWCMGSQSGQDDNAYIFAVNGKLLKWVDSHQNVTDIGLLHGKIKKKKEEKKKEKKKKRGG